MESSVYDTRRLDMDIRKNLVIVAVVAGLSLAGLQQVSARGWGGGNGGDCSCQGYGPGYQQLDDATKAKVDAFRADTLELRKQIAMKRAEKRALMSSQTPDAAAVAQVAGELFDLKTSMAEKASAAGVPMMGRQGRMDRAGGKGQGRGQRPCGNQQS
jgi:Spy/CpxP family protein refolding chaperone